MATEAAPSMAEIKRKLKSQDTLILEGRDVLKDVSYFKEN